MDEYDYNSDNEIYKNKFLFDSDSDVDMPDMPDIHNNVIVNHYGSVPDILHFEYNALNNRGKLFPVTVTMNVKHPDYQAINNPNQFKDLLMSFCRDNYKYNLNGILEFHKSEGSFRQGGLHLHGLVAGRNPPKNNRTNLFNFYITNPHENGIGGYITYCKKNIPQTIKSLN